MKYTHQQREDQISIGVFILGFIVGGPIGIVIGIVATLIIKSLIP